MFLLAAVLMQDCSNTPDSAEQPLDWAFLSPCKIKTEEMHANPYFKSIKKEWYWVYSEFVFSIVPQNI